MAEDITVHDFSQYQLEKSKTALNSAKLLYKHNDFVGSTNRAYYSILYFVKAVLALERIDFKKHQSVIGYFNKNYVGTEDFPKIIGKKIAQAKKIREDNDYDEEYEPSADTTQNQIGTAEELIKLVENHLDKII